MTELGVLQQGRMRRSEREARRRRARRRRRMLEVVASLLLGMTALLVFMASRLSEKAPARTHTSVVKPPPPHAPGYATTFAGSPIRPRGAFRLRSGLVFDVRSGRLLWARHPTEELPIASLTKMMTALVTVSNARTRERVLITSDALHYSGSGVGLLPKGKRVLLESLLYGLLLPSGNDAAIALADHVAGTQRDFISMMNARASQMDLTCTHFTTVSGIVDQGNHSCARDLARLAHAVLMNRVLAPIVASPSAVFPFPIKGGKLWLYNNNPLLILRYPGTDGVKTGYTVASGQCLVAAAKRGRRWYGVVLLHSANPWQQAERLLNAAFARRS